METERLRVASSSQIDKVGAAIAKIITSGRGVELAAIGAR